MNKLPIVILYVADQQRSAAFYECVLNAKPVLNVPGMTEFLINQNMKLGLMPESGIAKIIYPVAQDPTTNNGASRCELYLIVDDPAKSLENAINAGAKIISPAAPRDWGDVVVYCMDPDGHILALAH